MLRRPHPAASCSYFPSPSDPAEASQPVALWWWSSSRFLCCWSSEYPAGVSSLWWCRSFPWCSVWLGRVAGWIKVQEHKHFTFCSHSVGVQLGFSLSQQECEVPDFTSAHCCISVSRCFICFMVFSHWWMSCRVSMWACCRFSVVLSKAICWESRRRKYSCRHWDSLWGY